MQTGNYFEMFLERLDGTSAVSLGKKPTLEMAISRVKLIGEMYSGISGIKFTVWANGKEMFTTGKVIAQH